MTRITNVEILIDDTTGGVILTCRVATCVAVCRAAPVWVGHGPVYCPRRDHHPTRRCDGAPHSSRPRRQRTDQATQRRAALDLSFALPRNEAQAVQAAVNRMSSSWATWRRGPTAGQGKVAALLIAIARGEGQYRQQTARRPWMPCLKMRNDRIDIGLSKRALDACKHGPLRSDGRGVQGALHVQPATYRSATTSTDRRHRDAHEHHFTLVWSGVHSSPHAWRIPRATAHPSAHLGA